MTDEPENNTGSLFASPQSMGAFGSLPIPDVGPEGSSDVLGDNLPEDEVEVEVDDEEE